MIPLFEKGLRHVVKNDSNFMIRFIGMRLEAQITSQQTTTISSTDLILVESVMFTEGEGHKGYFINLSKSILINLSVLIIQFFSQ